MVHEGRLDSIYCCFQLTHVCGWIPLSCCGSLYFYLFSFWFSCKLLKIHSHWLTSLVLIQHPMGPGLIQSLQGEGDGTVTPEWTGERQATAVLQNWNLYLGVSCISFTVNWIPCCLRVVNLVSLRCSKTHQMTGKAKDFKTYQTFHTSFSRTGPPWGYQTHYLFKLRHYWKQDFQVWEQNWYWVTWVPARWIRIHIFPWAAAYLSTRWKVIT